MKRFMGGRVGSKATSAFADLISVQRHSVLALALCAFGGASAQAKPLKAVASFTVLADIVRNVAGDKAEVVSLVGPNGRSSFVRARHQTMPVS